MFFQASHVHLLQVWTFDPVWMAAHLSVVLPQCLLPGCSSNYLDLQKNFQPLAKHSKELSIDHLNVFQSPIQPNSLSLWLHLPLSKPQPAEKKKKFPCLQNKKNDSLLQRPGDLVCPPAWSEFYGQVYKPLHSSGVLTELSV